MPADVLILIQLSKVASQIYEIDVVNEDEVVAVAKAFGERPLDILINVAGIFALRIIFDAAQSRLF